jgi:hypothetical protein
VSANTLHFFRFICILTTGVQHIDMSPPPPRLTLLRKLQDTFHEVITGSGVKRSKHELIFDGVSVVGTFIEELRKHGYEPTTVDAVIVQPGKRVPAFYIEDRTAYFG